MRTPARAGNLRASLVTAGLRGMGSGVMRNTLLDAVQKVKLRRS